MAGNKIKLKDQLGRVVRVGGDTTPGATVGRDLRWPDGTIVKLSEIKNPAVDSSTGGMAPTLWKLIREILANIQKLAKLAGVGFTTRDADGEWYQRTIEAGEGIEVENGDGVAGDPTVALADVPDAGGGTLQKTAFDAKGRKTGTSTATTDDLAEGADNLYFTTARAAAAAPVQSVNGQVGAVSIPVPKGYIDGLIMQWGSASQIVVSSGDAYIPSLGVVVEVPLAITKSGLSLAASTWYHVYLFMNSGVPDVEVVTTAPASPYSGTARAEAGDASRRYIGSILTDSSAGIYRFAQNGDQIDYVANPLPPFRVLSGGSATTRTNVSLAGVVPDTSTYVIANTINNSDVQLFIDIPEIGNVGAATRYTCLANQRMPILAAVASRTLQYFYAVPPTGS